MIDLISCQSWDEAIRRGQLEMNVGKHVKKRVQTFNVNGCVSDERLELVLGY